MSQTPASPAPVKPLLSPEQMARIFSSRRSLSSEDFRRQVEQHLGRPLSPGRKKAFVNGREVWVCC